MKDIDYKPVCNFLKKAIQNELKAEGLVKTGKLLDSIEVTFDGSSFLVTAEDYYKYLDEKYNITEDAMEKSGFYSYFEKYLAEQIEKNIKI